MCRRRPARLIWPNRRSYSTKEFPCFLSALFFVLVSSAWRSPLLKPRSRFSDRMRILPRALLSEELGLQSPVPTARNLWGAAWATPTHAFAVGDGLTMIETFDAGATWRDVELSSYTWPALQRQVPRCQHLCRIGNSATTGRDIYRTTNAGATWQRLTNFPLGGSWDHIDFVSPTVGFMGANGARRGQLMPARPGL